MNWFRNLKIRMKMIVSFGLIIVLMAGLAVVSVVQLKEVEDTYISLIDYPIQGEKVLKDFWASVLDIRRITGLVSSFAATEDVDRIASLSQSARDSYNAGVGYLDEYTELIHGNPLTTQETKEERLRLIANIRSLFEAYNKESMEPILAAAKDLDHAKTMEVILAGTAGANDLMNATNDLLDILNASVDSYRSAATTSTNHNIFLLAVLSVIIVLIAIAAALLLAGLISKPLNTLSAFMNKAGSTGDITITPEDDEVIRALSTTKDEIGQSIAGSASFVNHVANIATGLETIADGDLTVEVATLSSRDIMGLSLQKMLANLNSMFYEIQTSAVQVTNGSKQIADGAQALAHGSMIQATSIEELSNSISEIAKKTKENAETAEKTAKLSETIKGNAEKGSQQMDDMIVAVKEINEASQSIRKIIKTIDDIAFQTNILALNAAVEAARAGQHGKGFAVVAEEVRNLASKSADAANDTGNMIQNSIEKAELGSDIAERTSKSLKEIVSGINESSQFIEEITMASDEQESGISQINDGIDKVAQVVQQNSATAEQSAAASEEMSGQSDMLQQLITRFKLKGGNAADNNY